MQAAAREGCACVCSCRPEAPRRTKRRHQNQQPPQRLTQQPVESRLRWWLSGQSGDRRSSGTFEEAPHCVRSPDSSATLQGAPVGAQTCSLPCPPRRGELVVQGTASSRESFGVLQQPPRYFGTDRDHLRLLISCLRGLETREHGCPHPFSRTSSSSHRLPAPRGAEIRFACFSKSHTVSSLTVDVTPWSGHRATSTNSGSGRQCSSAKLSTIV